MGPYRKSARPRRHKRTVDSYTRAVGYIRLSTVEQADSGVGLAAQRAAIESECTRRGWHLLDIHEDAGLSDKSMKGRDGLHAALHDINCCRAGSLIVAKLDRLSRSLSDFAALMADARAKGWNLVALDLGIDLSTPAGEFMASVTASAAQWERRIIGQRTRDALAVKRSQGVRLGRPLRLPLTTIDTIASMRASGMTYGAIARHLTDAAVPTAHGAATWWPATVRTALLSQSLTSRGTRL